MSVSTYKKVGVQANQGDRVEGNTPQPPSIRKKPWKSIMRGQNVEVCLASATLIFPMVAFSAVLYGLILMYRMPDFNSSYTQDNGTAQPLGQAYYVDYSSTTLVYIASLSSSISTLLVPAAMVLYSYSLAKVVARKSDGLTTMGVPKDAELPSPFQLELLIRMVDGRLTVLWSFLLYICGPRRRRTNVIPVLWHASAMMVALVVLAYVYCFLFAPSP